MINRESRIGNGKNKELIAKLQATDDHTGTDLSGEMLFGIDLAGKKFSKCDLTSVNFSGSNLSGCDFSSANLTDTNFTSSHIRNCEFTGARRGDGQISKVATLSINDTYFYAFLCQGKFGKMVLINEPNKKEYEFKRGGASNIAGMLYNLLFNG